MSTYYPELGEKRDETKIFHGFHVINDTYAIRWSPEDDAEARKVIKAIRIRPRSIEQSRPQDRRDNIAMWGALITGDAMSKLRPYVSREALLD